MANLVKELRLRLQEGGWHEKRHSGDAEVWEHPNGAIYPLGTTLKDQGRTKANALAAILRLERDGNPLTLRRRGISAPALPDPVTPEVKPKTRLVSPEPAPAVKPPTPTWFEWVRGIREASGLSPEDLADMMGDGATTSVVRRLELGIRTFSRDEFTSWSAIFNAPVPPGVVVPFASEADIAKRRGKLNAKVKADALHNTLSAVTRPPCSRAQPTPQPPAAPQPIPPEVPMPSEIPAPTPQVPASRSEAVAMVTKILSNPRLTDAEALSLAQETVEAATRTLLGL